MSFKSEAQREKFRQLVKEGKMSQKIYDEWESATPKKIPERLHTPTRAKPRLTKVIK